MALTAGDLEYVAGGGRSGFGERDLGWESVARVWIVANRLIYHVIAQPDLKTLQDLRGKRIGVSGLGATTHTAFTMAVEKAGANAKDFIVVGLGPQQQLRALESRAVDAVVIDPPVLLLLLKKGFSKIFDVGAVVEMPVGGLTTLTKTLSAKPDQVRRVIKAQQEAKELLLNSKERAVEFIVKTMKMDQETATKTHELMVFAWAGSGVPTRTGIENIFKGIQSQGRFTDKKNLSSKTSPTRASPRKSRASWFGHKE